MRKVIQVLALIIFALNVSFAQLGNTPWPMQGFDLQHTGRSPYNGPGNITKKWEFTADQFRGDPAIGADGTIYVGCADGNFYAINPTGTKKWSLATGVCFDGPAIAADGTIYVGTMYDKFYAINPDGTKKWSFDIGVGDGYLSSPAIATDGTIYIGATNNLYALNPDGTKKWEFDAGYIFHASPAIAPDGTIYVGSENNNLYAINPDGTKKWVFAAGDAVCSAPAIATDGTIYFGCDDNKLYALNPDGTKKWSYTTEGAVFQIINSDPAIAKDGTIYFADADTKVYALNPDGTKKWTYDTGLQSVASPIIGADGTIYIGGGYNNVFAFYPNGTLRWKFTTGDFVISTPAISADGILYIGCDDKKLYAIGTSVAPPQSLTITSPNGGEQWQQGSAHPVKWTSTGIIPNVKIDLFKGGILNSTIIASTPNTGLFNWTIPATLAAGTDYTVKIINITNVTIQGKSAANFAITAGVVKPTITVTAPNGGEQWQQGDFNFITWTSTGNPGNVKIELFKAGVFDSTIVASVIDNGRFIWTIPATQTIGTDYKVKISSVADATVTSQSAADFTIITAGTIKHTITVISPNGGEKWQQDSVQVVNYTSFGVTGKIKIELYKGGVFCWLIANATINTGTCALFLPATSVPVGTDYRVKLSSIDDPTVTATSAADFEVIANGVITKPTITITSPNGGEKWLQGSAHPITWTSTGNPGNVKIELFKTGVLSSVIAADIANNGTFNWTIPATQTVGTDYRVKISGVADATITSQSAADFEIVVSGAPANGPWPMFRHDVLHTGRSPFNGPTTAAVKWSFTAGDKVASSPAIGSDGTIYVGSSDNNLYALNPDGTKKWAFTAGDEVNASPAIGTDGTIYVGSRDYNLYALNPDGTKKWAFATVGSVASSPVIGTDGTIYVGSADDKVYAINSDGTQKWKFNTGFIVGSSPAISSDGTIYIGSQDKNLYALNPDGTKKWAFTTGDRIPSSPAIGTDGTIYIGSLDKNLHAINPDGTKKWAFVTGDNVFSVPAIGTDGVIYVGSFDKKVYAINPDGTEKWSYTTGDMVNSSPAIGLDGTIYIGSWDKNIYAFNPDGTKKWVFASGDAVSSSPSIGADGTLYVGSHDGKLYAFGKGGTITPVITITSPNGGEQWQRGTAQNITWTSTGITGNVKIELFKGGVFNSTISANVANSGSYNWNIPAAQTAGINYRVKISSITNATITSQSAADFAINASTPTPTITIISPNGGEQWQQGTTHAITWRSSNLTGTVKIDLYKTGTLNSVISATVANTGSYSWAIPGTQAIGTDYRVRISSVTTTSTVASSQSAGNFAITATAPAATITLTAPNGGEQWIQGSAQVITWTSNSVTGNVKIDLYKAGALSSTIIASVANSGTYNWTVPAIQTAGTDYRVRITAVANTKVFDDSDANFSITATVKTPGVPVQVSPVNNAVKVKLPVTIAWQPVSGAVSYEYELYSAASATVPVETNVVTTTSAIIQLALTDGTKYSWRVRATNTSAISSAYSSLWSFTTAIAVVPLTAPTLISPADGAIDVPLSELFTWSPVTNAIAYDIDISTTANFSTKATLSTTKTSITASLANITVYYWRVRAKQGINVSPWSTVNTFTTIAFVPTSGLDAAISLSKTGSPLLGVGVINDTGNFQTMQMDMPINRQGEFYIVVKNNGNQPDNFLITSTSTIGSKWRVNVYDVSGINRTMKVFTSGWATYTVKPGESVPLMLRFAAASGQVIDEANPPTQTVTITAKSLKDMYSGTTTPSSDTVVATAILVKRSGF